MKKIIVIGSLNMDQIVNVDHIPAVGETVLAGDISCIPGGKGANQAFGIARLGGSVSMLGAVGKDEEGRSLLESLSSAGVDTSRVRTCEEVRTGMAWIVVERKGNNSITVIPGANYRVDKGYIDDNLDMIMKADIIILQLEIPVETVSYVCEIAAKYQKRVILDPAPAITLPDKILKAVDILKPNETEARILTGTDQENYMEMASSLEKKGVKNVLISLGDKGIYACLEGKEPKVYPGIPVKAVDTTAAGDTFIAGLAVAISEGRNMEEAIEMGQKAASIAVTRKGAQSSMPSREELQFASDTP